jgi:hypothetical protein
VSENVRDAEEYGPPRHEEHEDTKRLATEAAEDTEKNE